MIIQTHSEHHIRDNDKSLLWGLWWASTRLHEHSLHQPARRQVAHAAAEALPGEDVWHRQCALKSTLSQPHSAPLYAEVATAAKAVTRVTAEGGAAFAVTATHVTLTKLQRHALIMTKVHASSLPAASMDPPSPELQ